MNFNNYLGAEWQIQLAKQGEKGTILLNLSGRGDKDIDFVVEQYGKDYGIEL